MAGYHELLAVEWDQNAVDTLRLNFPDLPIYHGDIAKLSVEECLHLAGIKLGELDVFDGSPPCQGFSTAGKRQIDDPRNSLFREYVRLLRGLQPKAFVMENVSGMVKGKMKLVFAECLRELKFSGYQVKARLLNSQYFQVPQSRQRMIFIGIRNDLGIEPSHPQATSTPISIAKALQIPVNSGALQYRRSYEANGKVEIATVLFDKPSLTITKTSNFSVKRYGDKIADITKPVGTITKLGRWFLSDKEEFSLDAYKRLGSFPDAYKLTSFSKGKQRIGNSVPPLFMRAIAKHVHRLISPV